MKTLIIALAAAVLPALVSAQQITVATGSPKGTYHALYTDIASACGNELAVVVESVHPKAND